MQISVSSTLTLYYDGQFWVGIVEHSEDGMFGVARIVFGAEPSDEEILRFVVDRWEKLDFFGDGESEPTKLAKNPKRRMRNAAKALRKPALSTKVQQALSEQHEAMKSNLTSEQRRKQQDAKQAKYALRVKKRKQKHRGR